MRASLNTRPLGTFCVLIAGVACLASLSGCAAVMAARAPGKKDLSVLRPGIPRPIVIDELGKPIHTDEAQGVTTDVFAFKQGYTAPTRYSRAAFHAIADFWTWTLWEIVATPLEGTLQGEEVRAEVTYTHDGDVNRVQYFAGAHLANGGPTLARWLRPDDTVQTATIEAPTDIQQNPIIPASATSDDAGNGKTDPVGSVQLLSE